MDEITEPNGTKTGRVEPWVSYRAASGAQTTARRGSVRCLPNLDSPPVPNGSATRRDTMLSTASPKQYLGCDAKTHTLVWVQRHMSGSKEDEVAFRSRWFGAKVRKIEQLAATDALRLLESLDSG